MGLHEVDGLARPEVRFQKDQAHPASAPQPPGTPARPASTQSIHRMSSKQRIQRRTRPDAHPPAPAHTARGLHLTHQEPAQHLTQQAMLGLIHSRTHAWLLLITMKPMVMCPFATKTPGRSGTVNTSAVFHVSRPDISYLYSVG